MTTQAETTPAEVETTDTMGQQAGLLALRAVLCELEDELMDEGSEQAMGLAMAATKLANGLLGGAA